MHSTNDTPIVMSIDADTIAVDANHRDGTTSRILFSAEDRELVESHKWCVNRTTGYADAYWYTPGRKQHREYAHRLVLGLVKGDGKVVDHVNGDKLDNRRDNLRLVTASENSFNRRGWVIRKWTQHDRDTVSRLRAAGYTYREIGEAVGRTGRAVQEYARRNDAVAV